MTSASNHGCFLIQTVLRQLGCGNGKSWGAYSENARTVSVIEAFSLPNSAVGRIDLPKASTGYPEDASAGAGAKAVNIPAEEDCRLRFLQPQDNKVPSEQLQLLPHCRRRSGPTSASPVSGRRSHRSKVFRSHELCSLALDR